MLPWLVTVTRYPETKIIFAPKDGWIVRIEISFPFVAIWAYFQVLLLLVFRVTGSGSENV